MSSGYARVDQSDSALLTGHSPSSSQRANMVELFRPVLYCLTPALIAPRVRLSGVKLR